MVSSKPVEKFDINWEEFSDNACATIRNLHKDKHFTDVTFVCDDGEQIPAHKVILSSCSKVFRNILTKVVHKNTLLYLNGIPHGILLKILDFVYLGRVEIASDDLDDFLKFGKNLKIEGLSSFESADSKANDSENQPIMGEKLLESGEELTDNATINTDIKVEENSSFDFFDLEYNISNPEGLKDMAGANIKSDQNELEDGDAGSHFTGDSSAEEDMKHNCEQCDYKTKHRHHLKRHQLTVHDGIRPDSSDKEDVKHTCGQCDYTTKHRNHLKRHQLSVHEGMRPFGCDECDYKFSQSHSLKKHKAKQHSQTSMS